MNDETDNEQEQTQETTQAAEAYDASMLAAPETDTRDTRIADLERELQQERVEKGRLRQTNDELRRAQEEIARLKAENANLTKRMPSDFLSPEEREKIDSEQLGVIDKMVESRIGDFASQIQAEKERVRQNEIESRKARFDAEVERLAPGLVQAVAQGHREEWAKWSQERRRASSVAEAFRTYDAEVIADYLSEFAETHGIRAEGDGLAARTSTFSPRGGYRPSNGRDGTTYTVEQYNDAMRRASADYDAGKISLDERRAIERKFNKAIEEGRIVQ